jgi:T-complex protein 1 subunit eta
VIPRTIADNAGLDSLDVMNRLRHKHATDKEAGKFFGVNIAGSGSGICNTYASFVWEPMLVKYNALSAACEAACTILSIDETVRNPRSEQDQQEKRIKRAAPRMGGGLQRNARIK